MGIILSPPDGFSDGVEGGNEEAGEGKEGGEKKSWEAKSWSNMLGSCWEKGVIPAIIFGIMFDIMFEPLNRLL
jgi:hypothetical protein